MGKCLKIIGCYLGQRSGMHNTPTDMLSFIKESITNEINIENGYETDVVFVLNESPIMDGLVYLLNKNNKPTKNGKIIIERRPNKNGSFGAYYNMVEKYMNDYDYFFFCEDDVLIYKDNYIKDFIDFCDSDESIGFVSLAPIHNKNLYPTHSGGGCGLTSKEKFLKVNSIEDIFNFNSTESINQPYPNLITFEINFTNKFVKCGLMLKNHPKYSPLCDNYKKHIGHKNNFKPEYLDLEFIYKVGN